MFSKLIVVMFCIFTLPVFSAVVFETGNVTNLRVIHWADDITCIKVANRWFKLNMTSEKGKATYALALAAFSTNKKVRVSWLDSSTLEGGCDSGTTMYPLYNFQFDDS